MGHPAVIPSEVSDGAGERSFRAIDAGFAGSEVVRGARVVGQELALPGIRAGGGRADLRPRAAAALR